MMMPLWFASAEAAPTEQQAGCLFFTETVPGEAGFYVCDDADAGFLTAFQTWGLQKVGYPISQRYSRDGFVTQAFQKTIMQWRTDTASVVLVNIFDDLHNDGVDDRLFQTRQVPQQLPAGWDGDAPFDEVVAKRQALLGSRPALHAAYFAAGDPLTFYGLPTSEITDMGNHYAIRTQRTVLQEWIKDVPWASAGEVTIANGGDIAKELDGLPRAALSPEGGNAEEASPQPSAEIDVPSASAPQPVPALPADLDPAFWQQAHDATINIRHPVNNPVYSGSGIMVGNDGRTFITAFHVIGDSFSGIYTPRVSIGPFADWRYTANVVAANNKLDLAILRVNEPDFPGFATAPIGKSSQLDESSPIYTLSYPGGIGELKTGKGHFLRMLPHPNYSTDLIMSDAPATFGSSGGVAVNARGEVIGIISAGILDPPFIEELGYTGLPQATLLVPIDAAASLLRKAGVE
jgi:hypothetical protein